MRCSAFSLSVPSDRESSCVCARMIHIMLIERRPSSPASVRDADRSNSEWMVSDGQNVLSNLRQYDLYHHTSGFP